MTIKDEVRKVYKEAERRRGQYTILKLPCGHGSVEITKPKDQFVVCPVCYKRFLLIWSKLTGRQRIEYDRKAYQKPVKRFKEAGLR